MLDARLSTELPSHPKTKKLVRRIGQGGAWCLVCLILWVRANRPDGDLAGMSDEDIELAVDWAGKDGELVQALRDVGFLEGENGAFRLHDWADHQPWAMGAEARSEKSRWAALCKQHGRREAAKLMPEYANRLLDASDEHASGMPMACPSGSAPSPSPSPSPKEKETSPNGEESAAASPAADPCPHAEIIAAYHEILPELARVRTWDADRQKFLRARWRESSERQSLGWWREFFEYVRRCPFLLGQESSGHRDPFLADLEWLIRPRNFRKVIEGKYEPRRAA